MSTAQARVVVVGAGVMGGFHSRVVAASPRAQLTAIVEPNEQLGREVAERYSTSWLPELPSPGEVDAVIIAAPTEVHPELARWALDNNIPTLVEKPIAADLADTEKLVASAERSDTPFMCGFVERFNPAVRTAAKLIEAPIHVTAARHSPYPSRIRTGVAWDLLIHDVDTCLRLVDGDLSMVRASRGVYHPASHTDSEDVAEAVLTFSSGAVAAVSASRVGQRKVRALTIAELTRTIELDLLRRDVTIYRHVDFPTESSTEPVFRQQTVVEIPELGQTQEPLAAQFDHFMDLIDGKADIKQERDTILPPHHVVDRVLAS